MENKEWEVDCLLVEVRSDDLSVWKAGVNIGVLYIVIV